ncbi:MAG: tetratricopeptide repeat protein [Rhodospirillaceae bacterium]|nr:tetratricopeptide repeat protein [Rhodospirillaceae bacterium]
MSVLIADTLAQGLKLLTGGDFNGAGELFQSVLTQQPNNADALHYLGVIAYQLGKDGEATDLFRAALQYAPNLADVHSNLGSALVRQGRFSEAEAATRRAIAINGSQAAYHFNLGNIQFALKRIGDALSAYKNAVELLPTHYQAWNNLGTCHRDLEQIKQATQCYERAVAIRPDYADALYNLANAYRDLDRFSDAEREIRKAIAANPQYAKAYNTLGNILCETARSDEARGAFARAQSLDSDFAPVASNLLCCEQYLPGVTEQTLADLHVRWAQRFAAIIPRKGARHVKRGRDKALRVGFVSPDLGQHPGGILSVRMFENLNHTQLQPFVFSTRNQTREDEYSKRIARVADWRRVRELSDEALALELERSEIDILIDMSGHTSNHRLLTFARKPAPLQISWLGYVGTTGLATMDYVIADRWHAPANCEIIGPEKYLRLSDGYVVFDPPTVAGPVQALPRRKSGHITFGCLNNPAKFNPELIKSYARILSGVPDSTLLMRFRGLDDPATRERLVGQFARHGIAASRLDMRGRAKWAEFLATYHEIDLALDTFPYSGGLTTCEALWMGVPVVTFPGATFAGRHATSHMSNAGLRDFVAGTQTEFEQLAMSWARDLDSLARLRRTLRDRVAASPLCDGPRFAASFANALRDAWHRWCAATPQ